MKKIITLIFVSYIINFCSCSDDEFLLKHQYHPFVQEGKIWSNGSFSYDQETLEFSPVSSNYITIIGDTMIDDLRWYKILRSKDELHINWEEWGFIREESKKVYYKWFDEDPIILYDFDLTNGDYIESISPNLVVDSIIFNELLDGTRRKHIYLSLDYNPNLGILVWIEGIGSISGFFSNTGNLTSGGGIFKLLCYKENNDLIYVDTGFSATGCFLSIIE